MVNGEYNAETQRRRGWGAARWLVRDAEAATDLLATDDADLSGGMRDAVAATGLLPG